MKRNNNAFKYYLIAGWLVTAIAILSIAPLIIPEESRSSYFWLRVIWSEVLCFLFWGGASSYFFIAAKQNDSTTRFGGITPTISIITTAYAALSFLAMVSHAYLANGDTSNRWHLIIQILLFAGTALTLVFLSISRAGATAGLSFDHSKAETPKTLHDLLAAHESALPNTSTTNRTRIALKSLRETIKYSFNESSQLSELQGYQTLCNDVKALCQSIEDLSGATEADASKITTIGDTATSLLNKSKLISANQVRG